MMLWLNMNHQVKHRTKKIFASLGPVHGIQRCSPGIRGLCSTVLCSRLINLLARLLSRGERSFSNQLIVLLYECYKKPELLYGAV